MSEVIEDAMMENTNEDNNNVNDNESHESEESIESNDKELKAGATKTYKHVAPRVDVDAYQAELPELQAWDLNELKARHTEDSLFFTPSRVGNFDHEESKVAGFLATIRNIFDSDRLQTGMWNTKHLSIPLESDEKILEYLARFDYNQDAALYCLMTELGYGKEVVQMLRVSDNVEKLAMGLVWSECKEKALSLKPMMMLGAYNAQSATKKSSNSLHNQQSILDICHIDADQASADASSGVVTSDTVVESVSSTGAEFVRVLGNRQASDSKSEKALLRKSWQGVHAKCSELLLRAATSCHCPPPQIVLTPSSAIVTGLKGEASSNAVPVVRKTQPRTSLEEALPLLEEASQLAPYVNAPGESFGESVRSMLGELLKISVEAKMWASEVKDALHGPARQDQATTLSQLRRLLKQGEDSLRVIPLGELTFLRNILAEAKLVGREARDVLSTVGTYISTFGIKPSGADGSTLEMLDAVEDDEDDVSDPTFVVKKDKASSSSSAVPSSLNVQTGAYNNRSRAASAQIVQQVDKIFSMAELECIQRRFTCLPNAPVLRREFASLKNVIDEFNSLALEVDHILVKADTCAVRRYKTPAGDGNGIAKPSNARMDIDIALALLRKIDLCPVIIPRTSELKDLADNCIAWKDEVRMLFRDSSTSSSGKHAAKSTGTKAVNLKKVELLLEEGERYPFELESELDLLRDRRIQAKAWLEKLKKNFQVKSAARAGSVRRGANAANSSSEGFGERLNLADMKTMVEEGSTMFEMIGDDSGSSRRDSAQVRELSKAQSVVEIAEEWINRMKELLSADPDSYIVDDDEDEDDASSSEGSGSKPTEASIGNHEVDLSGSRCEDEKLVGSDEKMQKKGTPLREVLREMLREAEDMPVHMDEVQVLRVHLQALDWAEKMRSILPLPTATDENRSGTKPSFAKVSELANEIKRIRAQLSPNIAETFSVKPLSEETYCAQTISTVEAWVQSVRRILQGPVVRKGTKLAKLIALYTEGKDFPVRLTSELRPLGAAISKAEDWIETYKGVLERLDIPYSVTHTVVEDKSKPGEDEPVGRDTDDAERPAASSSAGAGSRRRSKSRTSRRGENDNETSLAPIASIEDSDQAMVTADGAMEVVVDAGVDGDNEDTADVNVIFGDSALPLELVARAVRRGDSLLADFPEIRALRSRYTDAEYWLAQVQEKCPEHYFPAAIDTKYIVSRKSNTNLSAGASTLNQDSSLMSLVYTLNMLPVGNLSALIEDGANLKINFEREMVALKTAITDSQTWSAGLVAKLQELDEVLLAPIISQLKISSLLTDNFGYLREVELTTEVNVLSALNAEPAQGNNTLNYASAFFNSWNASASKVVARIDALQSEGASVGIVTDIVLAVAEYRTIFWWIDQVLKVVCGQSDNWADASLEEAEGLDRFGSWLLEVEGAKLLTPEKRAKLDTSFASIPELAQFCFGNVEDSTLDRSKSKRSRPNDENGEGTRKVKSKKDIETSNAGDDSMNIDQLPENTGVGDVLSNSEESEGEDSGDEIIGVDGEDLTGDGMLDTGVAFSSGARLGHEVGRPRRQRKSVDLDALVSGRKVTPKRRGGPKGPGRRKAVRVDVTNAEATKEVSEDQDPGNSKAVGVGRKSKIVAVVESPVALGAHNTVLDELSKVQSLLTKNRRLVASNEDSLLHGCIVELLDFFLRLLKLFQQRLREATQWNVDARQLMLRLESATPFVAKSSVPEANRLLTLAENRNIQSRIRVQLMDQLTSAKEWLTKAEAIVRRRQTSSYLSLDSTREFIRQGEKSTGLLVLIDWSKVVDSHMVSADSGTNLSQSRAPALEEETGDQDDGKTTRVESGSKSCLSMQFIQELKSELRRGKAWVTKLQATGADRGVNVASEILEPLLAEADGIAIDLSEYRDTLQQGMQRYCFCRQAYHGHMVGCDECEDWYHLSCVGLTQQQADKVEKYSCPRCQMKQSFIAAAVGIAVITNRWMHQEELLRWRETRKSKMVKRKSKEEREVQKIRFQLQELMQAAQQRARAIASATVAVEGQANAAVATEGNTSSIEVSKVVDPAENKSVSAGAIASNPMASTIPLQESSVAASEQVTAPLQKEQPTSIPQVVSAQDAGKTYAIADVLTAQMRPLQEELAAAQARLGAVLAEEAVLLKDIEIEKGKLLMVKEWMKAMQGVMWPNNSEDLGIGKPLEPPSVHDGSAESRGVQDEYCAAELGIDRGLLSEGMKKAHCAAVALGIQNIEDVVNIFEGFKWMSWVNLFLHAIRKPLPMRALRQFIDLSEPLKLADEKIVRIVVSWYQRASNWKAKVRKLCGSGSGKMVETSKLNALVVEGFGIPVLSRVKQQVKVYLEKSTQATGGAGLITSEVASAVTNAVPPVHIPNKRGPKPAAVTALTHTLISETLACSTDEERRSTAQPGNVCIIRYASACSDHSRAPAPKDMWPVRQIPFNPVLPQAGLNLSLAARSASLSAANPSIPQQSQASAAQTQAVLKATPVPALPPLAVPVAPAAAPVPAPVLAPVLPNTAGPVVLPTPVPSANAAIPTSLSTVGSTAVGNVKNEDEVPAEKKMRVV